jgi:predicted nicotinamide N-methyase
VTLTRLVRSATRLAPVPFVPEVSIHQVDDIYAVWELTERELGVTGMPPPFWGVAWPGGQALARYLLDHPAVVAGRTILDFGSGSGLVAIAAAKAGAGAVIAADSDPMAAAAIGINAAANNVAAPAYIDDVRKAGVRADVIVAGDVWYERELADQVSVYLDEMAAAGAGVLTGDIGRSYFPRSRYQCVASYEIPAIVAVEGKQTLRASVWRPGPATGADPAVGDREGATARPSGWRYPASAAGDPASYSAIQPSPRPVTSPRSRLRTAIRMSLVSAATGDTRWLSSPLARDVSTTRLARGSRDRS